MWPYWLLFFIPAYKAIGKVRPEQFKKSINLLEWRLMGLAIFLMVGFRFEVGGDWYAYLKSLDELNVPFNHLIEHSGGDLFFNFLSWLGGQAGMGIYLPNLLAAAAFTFGLMTFCRNTPHPWLAILLAVPYLTIVVAMGYTRQGAAIGMMLMALVAIDEKKILKFLFWTSIAALFHKSAVILVPLALFSGARRPVVVALVLSVTGGLLFILLLQEYVDFLAYGYLENKYQSSGAEIRVAMNAIPACVFLFFRSRFRLEFAQQTFWTWMSWGAVGFILLLYLSPSSTAVDRVALYWIPLQLYIGSRLPDAMGRSRESILLWRYCVIAYCGAVQFVWLFFADTAYAWIPYKFFPWEWLWK
jgi:hypothetical protein